jgi:Ankyrin repeats (many copies)/Ankyrin repeats (3 copies)
MLLAAARYGKTHFVPLLVSKGISMDAKNNPHGETALQLACAYGEPAYAEALLDNGADINSVTGTGATAALTAAVYGKVDCLQLLAERGADLSIRDDAGHTVLHAAATWGNLQCVTLLLSYSKDIVADVNTTAVSGSTPLMLCLRKDVEPGLMQDLGHTRTFNHATADSCAQLLLDNGASVAPDMLLQLSKLAEHDSNDAANEEPTATTQAMRALSDYMTRLRSSNAAHTAVLAVHTEALGNSSIQQTCRTGVHTDSSNSSSSSSSGISAAAAAATGEVQQNSNITVQLVHAVTGVKAAKLYKLELHTLARLLAVHSSVGKTSSVLLNLLRTPTGWRTTQEQQQQGGTIELKYDGTCCSRH